MNRWTDQEDATLSLMVQTGQPHADIAVALGRTRSAVSRRASVLGITRREKDPETPTTLSAYNLHTKNVKLGNFREALAALPVPIQEGLILKAQVDDCTIAEAVVRWISDLTSS